MGTINKGMKGEKTQFGGMAEAMAHKLALAFSPSELEIFDDSSQHAGHAGARPGGESHFSIRIVADAFAGKSRLDRHRMIHKVLGEELAGKVHALAITALSQEEKKGRPETGPRKGQR
jgi:BolA protein